MKKISLFLLPLLLIAGCTSNRMVSNGDNVEVEYIGTLSDGSVFDSTEQKSPLEFKVGTGEVIPGFEQAVIGMKMFEEKTFTISPQDAYGEVDEGLLLTMNRTYFIEMVGEEPIQGAQLVTSTGQVAIISEVTQDSVTVDFNNPLAGEELTFNIRIVGIQ